MKGIQRLVLLLVMAALLCQGAALAEETLHSQFVYGQSEMGRDLVCHRIGAENAQHSILLIFGIHGFEDAFDHDGEVLEKIAWQLIRHYGQNGQQLGSFCLYVIPSANPDGLLDGTAQEGFGRSNANNIDINRDFSSDWSRNTSMRNRTGKTPFSTAEARAIRDLVLEVGPDYAIDVHGWAECSYGNGKLAEYMADAFNCSVSWLRGGGMACAWLNTVTRESMLLELPKNPDLDGYVTENAERMVEGLNAWIARCDNRR